MLTTDEQQQQQQQQQARPEIVQRSARCDVALASAYRPLSAFRTQKITRAFQFGRKKFRFDSIRQSAKFAACTLIFK